MNQEKVLDGWAGKQWLPQQYINYRIKQPQYEEMWARQGGICPGCKQRLAHPWVESLLMGLKPDTDYLHVKGRHCEARDVRGVLCHHCNGLLGKMRDNMELLQGLLDYLKQHGDLVETPAVTNVETMEALLATTQTALPLRAAAIADGSKAAWVAYQTQQAARALPTKLTLPLLRSTT